MLLDPRQLLQLPVGSESRLTFKRLRRPTRLPTQASKSLLGAYLDRLSWMFGGR